MGHSRVTAGAKPHAAISSAGSLTVKQGQPQVIPAPCVSAAQESAWGCLVPQPLQSHTRQVCCSFPSPLKHPGNPPTGSKDGLGSGEVSAHDQTAHAWGSRQGRGGRCAGVKSLSSWKDTSKGRAWGPAIHLQETIANDWKTSLGAGLLQFPPPPGDANLEAASLTPEPSGDSADPSYISKLVLVAKMHRITACGAGVPRLTAQGMQTTQQRCGWDSQEHVRDLGGSRGVGCGAGGVVPGMRLTFVKLGSKIGVGQSRRGSGGEGRGWLGRAGHLQDSCSPMGGLGETGCSNPGRGHQERVGGGAGLGMRPSPGRP